MNKSVFLIFVSFLSALIFPAVFVQTAAGVEVDGLLNENTTWTTENSPYIITDTVQVPEDVVLTIQPDVTVTFSGEGDIFSVMGAIQAQGTVNEKIIFEGNGAANFFNVLESDKSSLSLDYCVFDDAERLWTIDDGIEQVILRHSELSNIATDSSLFHWKKACYIEYNVFVDAAGFGMYNWFGEDSGATIYIRYNVLKTNTGVFASMYPNVHGQGFVVQYNSFVDVDETVLQVNAWLGDDVDIIASQNYWGTTDTEIIDSLILDKNDEIDRPAVIEYLPILSEPHQDAAILPLAVSFEHSPAEVYVDIDFEVDASASFAKYSSISNYTWNFGDGTIVTLNEATTTHTFTEAGEYEVVLTVTDEFGFQNSTSTTVMVLDDITPPVTAADYDGDWQNSDFTITLTAVDDEIGVAETYYQINDGPLKTVSADGQPLINEESADNKLEFWSEDKAGNVEDVNVLSEIMLDATNPTIGAPTITPETDIQENQTVTIAVEVSDSLSGVETVTLSYSTNNGTTWNDLQMTMNSTTELWQATIPGQSMWTNVKYKILSYDLAGNLASSDETDFFSYDVIPEFTGELILLVFAVLTLSALVLKKKII